MGSVGDGSLFLTLPTRAPIGQQIMQSERVGSRQHLQMREVDALFAGPDRPAAGR
jgi:hypothetical protein